MLGRLGNKSVMTSEYLELSGIDRIGLGSGATICSFGMRRGDVGQARRYSWPSEATAR